MLLPIAEMASLHEMPTWLYNTAFPLNRWLHVVASTLLVGGVLFLEFVVPLATADLKEEQQVAVFGRARWAFRKVVWFSVVVLLLSGALSCWRMWHRYAADEAVVGNFWLASKPWVFGHVVIGLVAFFMVLRVMNTRRIPPHPVKWLRVALVLLLAGMFAASAARQVRLRIRELPEGQGDTRDWLERWVD